MPYHTLMPLAPPDTVYDPPTDPLVIIYRDDDILVLDKPSGLLSVPALDPDLYDSLLVRVREEYPSAFPVNRLDKDTSGIVLMALTKNAHSVIGRQFEARTTRKSYVAVVTGHMTDDEGLIDLPLGSDVDNKPRHRVDHENGKPSQTKWRVIERLPDNSTRVQLFPLTGRTHQLRVHLKAIGHTILGDALYADNAVRFAAPRLMLHAEMLGFVHPNGEEVAYTSPCPF